MKMLIGGGIIIKEGVEVATKYSENIMILICGISMENHNSVTWTPPYRIYRPTGFMGKDQSLLMHSQDVFH